MSRVPLIVAFLLLPACMLAQPARQLVLGAGMLQSSGQPRSFINWTPGTIPAGVATSHLIYLYGARVNGPTGGGDAVVAITPPSSLAPAGLLVSARVMSTNIVQINLFNTTGSPIVCAAALWGALLVQ